MAAPFSLYVHIPFCTAKCTYCDFNSYAGQDSLMAPYAEAVAAEARLWSPHMAGRRVETVFFGGGTPSLLPVEHMRTIVAAVRDGFDIAPEAEVSLEANPGTVDEAHLAGLREIGFNRISFGVQSFHDDELLQMERIHGRAEVEDAYRWARAAGFANVNLDLIFGLIGQKMPGWQENVEAALALAPEHLSLYALTLEEGTPLTRDVDRGRSPTIDLDLQADMYDWTRPRLAEARYEQYEISNWSRPGRECQHNLVYWRNGDWLGLGAGAHSHLFGQRFADAASPSRYIASVAEAERGRQPQGSGEPLSLTLSPGGRGDKMGAANTLDTARGSDWTAMKQITQREPPDERREMAETVILALRLREGLDLVAWSQRFDRPFASVFGDALQETISLGLTELVEGRLRLREESVLLGDEAFWRFLPDK